MKNVFRILGGFCLILFVISLIGSIVESKEIGYVLGWLCSTCWCIIALILNEKINY